MTESKAASYRVEAFNTASASENRIHDDETARRFGFHGGLVPGVEVYAYMAHMPVARYGLAWLERGGLECRFLKPVYDGHTAFVLADDEGDGLALSVESDGETCATGRGFLGSASSSPPSVDQLSGAVPTAARPPASLTSLAVGRALGIAPVCIDRERLARYLADVRETEGLYAREGIAHPGQILRLANAALMENVVLGPWIHVGSRVENFALVRLGDRLTLRSRIAANREHKGHAIVELEALVVANGAAVVAGIRHTAIWRPRQVADAAA
jgi:acyl dehydratase